MNRNVLSDDAHCTPETVSVRLHAWSVYRYRYRTVPVPVACLYGTGTTKGRLNRGVTVLVYQMIRIVHLKWNADQMICVRYTMEDLPHLYGIGILVHRGSFKLTGTWRAHLVTFLFCSVQ